MCQVSWHNGHGGGFIHYQKVVSSSPAVGKMNFSFCKSRFRSLQPEEAHSNEINNGMHIANTLFQIFRFDRKNMAAVCSGISLFMLALTSASLVVDCKYLTLGPIPLSLYKVVVDSYSLCKNRVITLNSKR